MKQYFFALAVSLLLLLGCAAQAPLQPANSPPSPVGAAGVPDDFSFTYSFGPLEADKYDSGSGVFSRDASCPSASGQQKEFALPLTHSEKEAIYRTIAENSLFSAKEDLRSCPPGRTCPSVTPMSGATLAFTANNRTRTISWRSGYPADDADYMRFARVTGKIDDVLNAKRQAANATSLCFYQ